MHTHSISSVSLRKREIYFKELAYIIVDIVKSKICKVDRTNRMCVCVCVCVCVREREKERERGREGGREGERTLTNTFGMGFFRFILFEVR